MEKVYGKFKPTGERGFIEHLSDENQAVIRSMERLIVSLEPPLQRLEYFFHPWVVFLILPIFALGNAGVPIEWGSLWSAVSSSQGLGIILGLFVGKQVGILGASWLALKTGLADIPGDLSFRHVYGGALLCGIGFTMSLFIVSLSLDDPTLMNQAKIAVLAASLLSGVTGIAVLSSCRKNTNSEAS
jgi:NhaA family Na+:H+ antiporter